MDVEVVRAISTRCFVVRRCRHPAIFMIEFDVVPDFCRPSAFTGKIVEPIPVRVNVGLLMRVVYLGVVSGARPKHVHTHADTYFLLPGSTGVPCARSAHRRDIRRYRGRRHAWQRHGCRGCKQYTDRDRQ
eukprot:1298464-Rhodomonas_salina.1